MGVIDMCFELNRLTFFIKEISCVKMLISNNTPNVQAPLGVSLLHLSVTICRRKTLQLLTENLMQDN
jgi:hypothetical protein